MNEELLYNEIYEKTKDCGRTQFIKLLQQKEIENKKIKKELKSTGKGLNKVLSKRKKWKDRYYKERCKKKQLEQENQQLKEYCCKRNECSGRLKENHKLTEYEIIRELEKQLKQKDKAIDECIEFIKSKFWEEKGSGYDFDEKYCDYGANFIDDDYDTLLEKLQQVKG